VSTQDGETKHSSRLDSNFQADVPIKSNRRHRSHQGPGKEREGAAGKHSIQGTGSGSKLPPTKALNRNSTNQTSFVVPSLFGEPAFLHWDPRTGSFRATPLPSEASTRVKPTTLLSADAFITKARDRTGAAPSADTEENASVALEDGLASRPPSLSEVTPISASQPHHIPCDRHLTDTLKDSLLKADSTVPPTCTRGVQTLPADEGTTNHVDLLGVLGDHQPRPLDSTNSVLRVNLSTVVEEIYRLKWEHALLCEHLSVCSPTEMRRIQGEVMKYARQQIVCVIFCCLG
jgi:hypothetical protein